MMNQSEAAKRPVNSGAVARIVIWSVVLVILCGVFILSMLSQSLGGFGLNIGSFSMGSYTYSDPDSYTVGGGSTKETVTAMEIDWVAGEVAILPTDGDEVRIEEDHDGSDDLALRWRVRHGKLSIKYRKSYWGIIRQNQTPEKSLTIYIPRTMLDGMREIELDVVDTHVTFEGKTGHLAFDGVDSDLSATGHIGDLEVDLVDGEVHFTGTLGEADFDGVDLATTLYLDAARELDIDGVDHAFELYLADAVTGFAIEQEGVGGDLTILNFENVTGTGRNRRWGDGNLAIDASGVDTCLTVKKWVKD